jgi:hypothetical protein
MPTYGQRTVCHRKMIFDATTDDPFMTGTCPQGFDILEFGYEEETAARCDDRDGNLIKRVLHAHFPAGNPVSVVYNSVTGESVAYRTDSTETDDLTMRGAGTSPAPLCVSPESTSRSQSRVAA